MCGRFSLTYSSDALREYFELAPYFGFDARYNIAPTDNIPVVREEEGERRLVLLRWGLHPSWFKDPPDKSGKLINARVETCHQLPSFRAAFRLRRCIIPASGFYEWQPGGKGKKQPFHIHFADGRPMAFAGLWERWEDPAGQHQAVESCTIIVGPANEQVQPYHDRMPIILKKEDFATWFDPEVVDVQKLRSILEVYQGTDLQIDRVSTKVNRPGNEGPDLLEPEEKGL